MVHEASYRLYQEMGRPQEALPDDIEVSVPTLLATKLKKGELIKIFVERFRSVALRFPSDMTQSILIETYRHNLQTTLLEQIEVTQSRT